jgi:glycosyltransferase involved in cell wall biosynthesis
MRRVLMVTTIPPTLRAFLLPFAAHFRNQGWHVDAMAEGITDYPQCVDGFDQVWNIKWSRNPLAPRNLISAPRTIRAVVAQQKYDLVHVHTPVAGFVTRLALNGWRKRGKLKVLYTAHGFHFHPLGNPVKNAAFIALEKLAGRWTDGLVVINRDDEVAAHHHRLVDSQRIHYMPGIGVDTQRYSPTTVTDSQVTQVRQELGLTPETPLFLSIAEFIPRKRHADILHALARLNRPAVHLALAGDGPLRLAMQQLATDLGILDRVHFLGNRSDIPVLIRASLATILVSSQEGLPRSVMESLSLETPVIGSKIRGTQELLEGGCGLLVEMGAIEELARAIEVLLDQPEQRLQMGKQGRHRMTEVFDLNNIIKLHDDLYTDILTHP